MSNVYPTKFPSGLRAATRVEQKISEPALGVLVTLGCKHIDLKIYNKHGCIESTTAEVDGTESNDAENAANLDENARLTASIQANSAYAYAVSLRYVNVVVIPEVVAKKFPKVPTGIQPVSPVPSCLAAPNLTR
jgi:hypothetical protein